MSLPDSREAPMNAARVATPAEAGGELHLTELPCRRGDNGYAQAVLKYQNDRPTHAEYLDENDEPLKTELVLAAVLPDKPAARLGLKADDVVEEYDGKNVVNVYQYSAMRQLQKEGVKPLVIRRNGKRLAFNIPSGEIGLNLADRVPGVKDKDE
jgi:hypothetical protein